MMLHHRYRMSYCALEQEMHSTSLKEDSSLGSILLYTQIRSLPASGKVNEMYLCRQQFMMTRWWRKNKWIIPQVQRGERHFFN
jgi:hypothetical protein